MPDLEALVPQESAQGYTQADLQTRDLFLGKLKLSNDFEQTLNFTERENTSKEYKKEAEFEVKKGESFSYRYTYLGKDYQGEFSAVSGNISYNTQDTLNAKFLHNSLRIERVEAGINADGEPIYKMKLQIPESFNGAVHITTGSGEAVIFSDVDYIRPESQEIEREAEVLLEYDSGEIESFQVGEDAEELSILESVRPYDEEYSPSNLDLNTAFDSLGADYSQFQFDIANPELNDFTEASPSLEEPASETINQDEEPEIVPEPKIQVEPEAVKEQDLGVTEELNNDIDFEDQIPSQPQFFTDQELVEEPKLVIASEPQEITSQVDFGEMAGNLLNNFSEYVSSSYIRGSDNQLFATISSVHLNDFSKLGDNPVAELIRAIPEGDVSLFNSNTLPSGNTSYLVLDSKSETFFMYNQFALSSYILNKINENNNSKTPVISPTQLNEEDLESYIRAYENYNPEERPVVINDYAVIRDEEGKLLLSSVTEMTSAFVLFDPKEIEESMDIGLYAQNYVSPKSLELQRKASLDSYSRRYGSSNIFSQAP